MKMNKNAKIHVAGHTGMVGAALMRALKSSGYNNLVVRSHRDLDLREQRAAREFFAMEKPEFVFLAAATVGGIQANAGEPATFITDNLYIGANVIDAAFKNGCRKMMFIGSGCIYPKHAPQPIREDYLLTGPLEPTNDAFALAKIACIRMARAYREQYGFDAITVMPANLYGPGDSFHPQNSHVLPAMIRRFHEAKTSGAPSVTIWGSGKPLREFLHVDDMAKACVFLMGNYSESEPINIGAGEELSIFDLAKLVAKIVGYAGEIKTDPTKPDGTPRKLLDSSRLLEMGWKPEITMETGLQDLYQWYLLNQK